MEGQDQYQAACMNRKGLIDFKCPKKEVEQKVRVILPLLYIKTGLEILSGNVYGTDIKHHGIRCPLKHYKFTQKGYIALYRDVKINKR